MKNIFLFLFISFTLLALNACKKKNDTAPPVITSSMSYKVDGVTKQASNAVAVNNLAIGGLSSTESILISIHTSNEQETPTRGVEVGTYNPENSFDAIQMSYSIKSPKTIYFGETGALKITYLTADRIKGTFEFMATDTSGRATKVITDGVFDCEIKKQP